MARLQLWWSQSPFLRHHQRHPPHHHHRHHRNDKQGTGPGKNETTLARRLVAGQDAVQWWMFRIPGQALARTSSCYLYHVAKLFLPMHNYHFGLYCMYWSSMHKIRLKIFAIYVSVKGPDKFQKYLLIEHWDMYVVTKFASIHCQVCIVRKMLIVCPPDLLKPKETTSLKRSSDTTDSLMDHLRTSNNNRQFNR